MHWRSLCGCWVGRGNKRMYVIRVLRKESVKWNLRNMRPLKIFIGLYFNDKLYFVCCCFFLGGGQGVVTRDTNSNQYQEKPDHRIDTLPERLIMHPYHFTPPPTPLPPPLQSHTLGGKSHLHLCSQSVSLFRVKNRTFPFARRRNYRRARRLGTRKKNSTHPQAAFP